MRLIAPSSGQLYKMNLLPQNSLWPEPCLYGTRSLVSNVMIEMISSIFPVKSKLYSSNSKKESLLQLGPDRLTGGQCITVDATSYLMHFDGWKCYFCISKPSDADLVKYPIIWITSPLPYEPQMRRSSRRLPSLVGASSDEWRARVGFPTLAVTYATNPCTHHQHGPDPSF